MAPAHRRSTTPETGRPPSPEVARSSSDISCATASAWSIGEAIACEVAIARCLQEGLQLVFIRFFIAGQGETVRLRQPGLTLTLLQEYVAPPLVPSTLTAKVQGSDVSSSTGERRE